MAGLIIASVVSLIGCVALFVVADAIGGVGEALSWIGGAICLIVFIVTLLCVAVCGYSYKASEVKAQLINREYGTAYTREEVFYGSEVIDTIRELNRTRIEINSNLGKKEN